MSRRIGEDRKVELDETDHSQSKKRKKMREVAGGSGGAQVNTNSGGFDVMCRDESLRVMQLICLQQQFRPQGVGAAVEYTQPLSNLSYNGTSSASSAMNVTTPELHHPHGPSWSASPLQGPATGAVGFVNASYQPGSDHLESYLRSQTLKRLAAQQKVVLQQQRQCSNRDAFVQGFFRPQRYGASLSLSHGYYHGVNSSPPVHGHTNGIMMAARPMPPVLHQPMTTPDRVLALPALLSRPNDVHALSPLQVFLREQIELYEATHDDIVLPRRGRNKRIYMGQVGLRCRHCAHVPPIQRQKGCVYFPATCVGLYQAAQNMNTTHLQCGVCVAMPNEVKQQYAVLWNSKGHMNSGAGRAYWAECGKLMGLVDTSQGIYCADSVPASASLLEPSGSVPVIHKSKAA